jgi:hypothetical protein
MKTTTTKLAAIALVCFIGFSSCRKKEKEEIVKTEDNEQVTANDNNLAEGIASDIDLMGSQVSENGSLSSFKTTGSTSSAAELGLASVCATVSGVGTQIITVDFGSTPCIGADGRTRSGKLIYNFSASSPSTAVYYRNPGFNVNVTSLNYVVDGYQVNIISKNINNTTSASIPTGINPGTNLTWAITANISITKPNNSTLSWTCNRTKELLNTNDPACYQGQTTAINWSQAQVKINGNSSGTNAQGESFTATATNLVRYMTCTPDANRPGRHPFISGTLAYTPGTRLTRTINFGSVNSCDFNAVLSIANQTFNIVLP